jgi:hypothetical protein
MLTTKPQRDCAWEKAESYPGDIHTDSIQDFCTHDLKPWLDHHLIPCMRSKCRSLGDGPGKSTPLPEFPLLLFPGCSSKRVQSPLVLSDKLEVEQATDMGVSVRAGTNSYRQLVQAHLQPCLLNCLPAVSGANMSLPRALGHSACGMNSWRAIGFQCLNNREDLLDGRLGPVLLDRGPGPVLFTV